MADHLELWTGDLPAPQVRPHDAPGEDAAAPPAEIAPPVTTVGTGTGRQRRDRGPFVTYLSLPWSYGDRDRSDRWHRVQCRRGRHEMGGGHTMHLGGDEVFIERRCRWCGAGPPD